MRASDNPMPIPMMKMIVDPDPDPDPDPGPGPAGERHRPRRCVACMRGPGRLSRPTGPVARPGGVTSPGHRPRPGHRVCSSRRSCSCRQLPAHRRGRRCQAGREPAEAGNARRNRCQPNPKFPHRYLQQRATKWLPPECSPALRQASGGPEPDRSPRHPHEREGDFRTHARPITLES